MQFSDYMNSSVTTLLDALEQRKVTSLKLIEYAIERINMLDKAGSTLNAITWLFEDEAKKAAIQSDMKRSKGIPSGKLEGIPVLIKDNIEVAGWPTTAGSVALQGIIAEQDAPIVAKLREEGAILLGKTAMHELAAGITGASSLSGFAQNAWVPGYSPGGSSSGSAVVVAAGYVPLAIGTDTAGSVRIPAAFNNLYGLRATRGSIPSAGIVPLSPTQDIAGPFVRSAGDLRLIHEVLSGKPCEISHEDIKVGLLTEWLSYSDDESESINALIMKALEKLGGKEEKIPQLHYRDLYSLTADASIITFEFAESLERFLSENKNAKFKSLKEIIDLKLYHPQLEDAFSIWAFHKGMSDDEYSLVQDRQARLYQDLEAFFSKNGINILAYPVIRHSPVKIGQPQQLENNAFLSPVTGAPALSVPVGFTPSGFPVGMELLALKNKEDLLIKAASVFPDSYSALL
ncbi:putative amidase [Xenorhabdus mauleonii]|uniref:Amidase n=1 Tax=Xenorhabdus mauleonii TaxID=351675 RepID=A0A1I3LYU2_9GAMM|nr:amidase [Xenorhabdus mauleonii]PHM45347.1 putative amidase [Xenorhabdus mauleonii]SFI89949.1 mandelamide amidase [Xenorhabdus mauleonii]